MVHVDPLGIDWFRMTLWGVLLTRGVGNRAENSHTSFESPHYEGASTLWAAGAGTLWIDSSIDSFIDTFENSVASLSIACPLRLPV